MKSLHNLMTFHPINTSYWHLFSPGPKLGNGDAKIHRSPSTQGVHNHVEIKTLEMFPVPNLRGRIVMGFIPTVNTDTEWESCKWEGGVTRTEEIGRNQKLLKGAEQLL